MIAGQPGACAGLWSHTPVDWRGNELELVLEESPAEPPGWPENAFMANTDAGSRDSIPVPDELSSNALAELQRHA
jgi:hypothetical protein